jgi:DNA-binding transcriptional ArsR family regulator
LGLLRRHGELSAGVLAEHLDISKPTLSHHLAALTRSGLLDREKRGLYVYYRLNQSLVEEVVHAVFDLLGVGETPAQPQEDP